MNSRIKSWGKIDKINGKNMNRKSRRRANWKHKEFQGEQDVVKGLSHRVIVVKSPDKRYFEEAIFVLKDEVVSSKGVDGDSIIKEARRIAGSYVKGSPKNRKNKFFNLPAPIFAAIGAAATGLVWLTTGLCGV